MMAGGGHRLGVLGVVGRLGVGLTAEVDAWRLVVIGGWGRGMGAGLGEGGAGRTSCAGLLGPGPASASVFGHV